jgi:hypothetical protein
VIGTALLFTASSVNVALIMATAVLTVLGGSLFVWTTQEIRYFPTIATQKAIAHYARYTSMISPTRRQVPFAFPTTKEMNHLFHAIDKMNPPENELILIENWIAFIASCDKDFEDNPPLQRILSKEMVERYGPELDPDEFPEAFGICIRMIGQLKRTGKISASEDRLLKAFSSSTKIVPLTQIKDLEKNKAEFDESDEDDPSDDEMAAQESRPSKGSSRLEEAHREKLQPYGLVPGADGNGFI